MDIKHDVKINKFRLDDECEQHPAIYQEYAEAFADARTENDAAADNLKRVRAETELEIRTQVEAGTFPLKATEASITASVESNKKVDAAKERMRKAQSILYHCQADLSAMDHRKTELDNLCYLWGKQYYSKPEGQARPTGTEEISRSTRQGLNAPKSAQESEHTPEPRQSDHDDDDEF